MIRTLALLMAALILAPTIAQATVCCHMSSPATVTVGPRDCCCPIGHCEIAPEAPSREARPQAMLQLPSGESGVLPAVSHVAGRLLAPAPGYVSADAPPNPPLVHVSLPIRS